MWASSFSLACCFFPSSLIIFSLNHWYGCRKREKDSTTVVIYVIFLNCAVIKVAGSKTSDPCTFIEALEDSGTPFSYFPVMIPQAKGDQETTPTPSAKQWALSISIENTTTHSHGQLQVGFGQTHLSCDRVLAAEFPPCPFGRSDIPPAHTPVESD